MEKFEKAYVLQGFLRFLQRAKEHRPDPLFYKAFGVISRLLGPKMMPRPFVLQGF